MTDSHLERFSTQVGATTPADPTMLPRTIDGIVFALIIIPVSIAALDTLDIAAISQLATAMLRIILDAIPHVIAAGMVLAVAYVIAKFASRLLTQFLATAGFDRTTRRSASSVTRKTASSARPHRRHRRSCPRRQSAPAPFSQS
ncbi:mechanosensitive ion channel [Sphingomonas faeni]|uniref:mechanosensitive ion channel n=1 Tax=Sphingomonas faeni TaxID=185950 RepID=UPI0033492EEE